MVNTRHKMILIALLLPLMVGGCATQGTQIGASVAPLNPVASTPLTPKPAPQIPPPGALEMHYGIQVTQISLTASGGLVDVRFKILDAAKARALLGNAAQTPVLIAGDNPPLMAPHNALRGARFGQGQVFYILYPNLRSAIKPGGEVTVAMGEARLGPVIAH